MGLNWKWNGRKKVFPLESFSVRAASEGSTPKASDGDVSVILAPIYSLRSFHVTGMPRCLSTYTLIEGIENVPQCAFRTTAIWNWNNKSTQGLPVCRDPSKPVMKRRFLFSTARFSAVLLLVIIKLPDKTQLSERTSKIRIEKNETA